jgi:adenylate kinase
VQEPEVIMAAAAQLEDVPNESLFSELLTRMKCEPKPEKRIILVGTSVLARA